MDDPIDNLEPLDETAYAQQLLSMGLTLYKRAHGKGPQATRLRLLKLCEKSLRHAFAFHEQIGLSLDPKQKAEADDIYGRLEAEIRSMKPAPSDRLNALLRKASAARRPKKQ